MEEKKTENHHERKLYVPASANKLLHRVSECAYVGEWTDLLKKEKDLNAAAEESSLVVFRISSELFALATEVFAEVMKFRQIHTLPHRTNDVLLGCVNFRGQLWLCASLHKILEIEACEEESYRRMVALQKEKERWVVPVDEVFGVHHYDLSQLQNVPVTVKKSMANYIKGIFPLLDRNVAVLDEDLLLYSLRRSLS